MVKDIKQYLKNISRLDQLYKRLTLEKIYTNTNDSTNSSYVYVLSKDNDVELLKNIKSLYDDCMIKDLDSDLEYYKLDTQAQIICSQKYIKNVEHFNPWSVDEGKVWKKCLWQIDRIKKVLVSSHKNTSGVYKNYVGSIFTFLFFDSILIASQ